VITSIGEENRILRLCKSQLGVGGDGSLDGIDKTCQVGWWLLASDETGWNILTCSDNLGVYKSITSKA
jgi:hypothetical protein